MSFPIHDGTPVTYGGPLPDAADVVVIGGGVIGVMTAWHLVERGLSVVVCEKGRVAGEQSSRNWGWIRQQGRDLAELPIMMESMALWAQMAEQMPGLGFHQQGVMYLARGHDEMQGFERWTVAARAMGLDARLQSAAQVYGRYPGASVQWVGGLYTASDAMAEPWAAVPLLAAGAVARGAVIVEDCAVRRLDRAGGRVVGVFTEKGRIACDQVVVAGGAWSSLFLAAEGVALPQLSVLASVMQTEPMGQGQGQAMTGCLADDRMGVRLRAGGGYTLAPGSRHNFYLGPDAIRNLRYYLPALRQSFRNTRFRAAAPDFYPDGWRTPRRWSADQISPFERLRILNPAPDMQALATVQDDFAAAFPNLGRPTIRTAWAGMIDTLPGDVPVVDRVASLPGLIIATGMCGHGFGIGPGIGRVVADLVAGNSPGHDLTRFRLGRFTDGSPRAAGSSV